MFAVIVAPAALTMTVHFTPLKQQYTCSKENFQLQITVLENATEPILMWTVKDLSNQTIMIEGQGPLSRESETEFSGFDESTAAAYKPGKAVIVLPDNSAVLFDCFEDQAKK